MNDSQKIEELLHHFRMEQKDFAEKCVLVTSNFSQIKAGKCGISKRLSEKIVSAFPEVNKTWLATGDGEMINSVNQSVVGDENVQTDNAIFHKAKKLVIPDNIVLINIPPYSPELNPAEQIWAWFKRTFTNKMFTTM